jgi:hypothetical protein
MWNAVKRPADKTKTQFFWTMEPQRPADVTPYRLDAVMHAFDVVVAGRSESSTAGRSED